MFRSFEYLRYVRRNSRLPLFLNIDKLAVACWRPNSEGWVAMRRRRFKTEADIARYIKEGFGQGEGSAYKPWVRVQERSFNRAVAEDTRYQV
jgi:hypothetical protein